MKFKEFYEESKSSNGTYVSAELSTVGRDFLFDWAVKQSFCDKKDLTPANKYHVTVLFSRKEIPQDKQINEKVNIKAAPKDFKLFDSDDNKCLVLELDCPELVRYHKQLIAAGGTHDHPDFIPHITLAYKIDPNLDLTKLTLPPNPIIIKEIKSEPLDLNWKDKLDEEA